MTINGIYFTKLDRKITFMYYVYIITNYTNSTIYTGITNNLIRRIKEHKDKINPSFSSRYNLYKLVYFEVFDKPLTAINREKQIKKYNRMKKDNLIKTMNPDWNDLLEEQKFFLQNNSFAVKTKDSSFQSE
jgi:putative endonuclease